MSFTASPGMRPANSQAPRAVADRRGHKRVNLTLLGRFMRANKSEYPCRLLDISVGGAAILGPVDLELGERVVAIFDQIGAIEGTVVRNFDGGFAISLTMTQHKREKLASTLMFILNKSEMPGIEARRHDRVVPVDNKRSLDLGNGITTDCRVLDISLSGASVETAARPPLGVEVKLGSLRARVVRHHESGVALQFIDLQNPTAFRRHFG